MDKVEISIFVAIFLFSFSLATALNVSLVESQFEKMAKTAIERESILAQSISMCSSFMKISSSNLQASKIAKNLTNSLDRAVILLNDLRSLKNHRNFESIVEASPCDYVNSRISSTNFESWNFAAISTQAIANLTKFFQARNEISINFAKNFKILQKFPTKQKTVISVYRQVLRTINDFVNYFKFLDVGIKFLKQMEIYLNASIICPPYNQSFQARGDKIDVKLTNFENDLKGKNKLNLNLKLNQKIF